MVNTIEVQDKGEYRGKSSKRTEKTSDIAKIVQSIVNDTLDELLIPVEAVDNRPRYLIEVVIRVSRRSYALSNLSKNLNVFLEEKTDGKEWVAEAELLDLNLDGVLYLFISEQLVARYSRNFFNGTIVVLNIELIVIAERHYMLIFDPIIDLVFRFAYHIWKPWLVTLFE